MGASSSGLLDEAKISNTRGKVMKLDSFTGDENVWTVRGPIELQRIDDKFLSVVSHIGVVLSTHFSCWDCSIKGFQLMIIPVKSNINSCSTTLFNK